MSIPDDLNFYVELEESKAARYFNVAVYLSHEGFGSEIDSMLLSHWRGRKKRENVQYCEHHKLAQIIACLNVLADFSATAACSAVLKLGGRLGCWCMSCHLELWPFGASPLRFCSHLSKMWGSEKFLLSLC